MGNQNEDLHKKVEKLENEVIELKKQVNFLLIRESVLNSKESHQNDEKTTKEKALPKIKPLNRKAIKQESVDIEALIFQKWLPRFFIFIFIIGIMWGFKAASDYGILNKYTKVGIGFLLSIILMWYGNRQIKAKRSVLGQTLLGGVLPVLFLTTFAMHHLYRIINSNVAFIFLLIWVGLGVYIMNKYKSEAIGLISVLGAILVPFLIKSSNPNYLFFTIYETAIYFLFMVYAAWKKYKFLFICSAILPHLVFTIVGTFNFNRNLFQYFTSSMIIQHLVLLILLFKSTISIKKQVTLFHTSFVLTIGWIFAGYEGNTLTSTLIFFCLLYLFLSNYYRKKSHYFFAFTTNFLLAFSFLCLDSVTHNLLNTVLIIQGILTYLFYVRYRDLIKLIISILTLVPVCISIISVPFTSIWSIEAMDWFVLIIAIITLSIIAFKNEKEKSFILITGSLLTTFLVVSFITQFVQIITKDLSESSIRISINLSWIIISILAMVLGSIKKIKIWTYIGIGLLLITLGKLVLIDLPNLSLLVRAALFILLGVIGLSISRIFFKGK